MRNGTYSIDELLNIVTPIAKAYGVERVYLFGSYARGEATENSDIDLRIERGQISDLFMLAEFSEILREKLGVSVDVLTTGALAGNFLKEIEIEEVILYAAS